MRKYFLIVLLYIFSLPILAENATNVRVRQEGKSIIITYDLKQKSLVKILMASGNSDYYTELKAVTGNVGKGVPAGNSRKVVWKPLEEKQEFIAKFIDTIELKKDNKGNLLCAALFLEKSLPLGYKYIYSPRGFVIDFNDKKLLKKFTEELKSYMKKNKIIYIKIDPDIKYHPEIRNEEACYQSTKLAVQLAKETGARLHILHISTAKELSLLENKPLSDKNITAEACVSHLFFSNQDYKTHGARVKCNPSIKTPADRDALREALTNNLIDVIGTDHAPHLLSEKEGGALKAVSGMPTIQFSLTAVMELVHQGIISIEQLVQKMCHAPASLYQIAQRGYIRPGYQADLVLINPHKEWTVTKDCLLSKCGWSPMEEQTFHSKVEKTFVNGNLVYTDNLVNSLHRGQALSFTR
jgi:hypothetical protein